MFHSGAKIFRRAGPGKTPMLKPEAMYAGGLEEFLRPVGEKFERR
jgi:hypothetical protein